MIDKLIAFFDDDNQFKQLWQLKLIKFDTDLDEDIKPYQKYMAISHIVEDSKGNPGIRGHFFVTNLRLVWHAANDREMNLSIGLDTINNVYIKSSPHSSQSKHTLIVKTQSPNGSKYEFKFTLFNDRQLYVFNVAINIFKEALSTKIYRIIDTNLKINYENRKFESLPNEEIFNSYAQSKYYEDERVFDCDIVLTNIRLIILQMTPARGVSYGIPWIMIQSYEITTHWDHNVIQLKARGLLSQKQIFLRSSKSWTKLESQFVSLASIFTKNPILGIDVSRSIPKEGMNYQPEMKKSEQSQFEQVFETKVNVKRTKNEYAAQSSQGNLKDVFFNEELGLMMEKLGQGETRSSLWQILG